MKWRALKLIKLDQESINNQIVAGACSNYSGGWCDDHCSPK